MELDRRELKRQAREAMGLAQPPFWLVALVYLLMTMGVSCLLSALPLSALSAPLLGSLPFFINIFFLLYKMVVDFGFQLWSLWTVRRLEPGIGSLMQGFSVTGQVLLMELMIALRVLGWAVCLGVLLVPLIPMLSAASPALALLAVGLLYAGVWFLSLRYSMAPYLLADRPEDGFLAAVRRSVSLLRGWNWTLCKLELSFLGWLLLSFLLSSLATVFCLWRGGFFLALSELPLWELPDLVSGYGLWQAGLSLESFPSPQLYAQLYTLYYDLSNQLSTVLLADLVTVPLLLWLLPYRLTARAGFYCHRLRFQQEIAPPV